MSARSDHSLNTVREVRSQRRDDALLRLAELQRELDHARDQMQQLQDYVAQAHQRWKQRATQGVTAALLHHQQRFMAKVEHAIALQQDVLRQLDERLLEQRTAVMLAERGLAGLNKYTERLQQAQQKASDRLEQKATDETAANTHRRQQQHKPWS